MNKSILARSNKNCKAWEGHRRPEKGNQVRKHQMKLMEIKHSEKWKVLTITDKKKYTSTVMTTTKQNNQKYLAPEAKSDYLLSKRESTSLSFPLEAWLKKEKKKSCTKDTCVSFLVLLRAHLDLAFDSR